MAGIPNCLNPAINAWESVVAVRIIAARIEIQAFIMILRHRSTPITLTGIENIPRISQTTEGSGPQNINGTAEIINGIAASERFNTMRGSTLERIKVEMVKVKKRINPAQACCGKKFSARMKTRVKRIFTLACI
jgi:hypothetical protein